MSVMDEMANFFSGVTDSYVRIEKELDSAMKGAYSKKVISTIEDEVKKYDKLS